MAVAADLGFAAAILFVGADALRRDLVALGLPGLAEPLPR